MITPADLVPEIHAASDHLMAGTYKFNSTQTFDMRGKPSDNDSDND